MAEQAITNDIANEAINKVKESPNFSRKENRSVTQEVKKTSKEGLKLPELDRDHRTDVSNKYIELFGGDFDVINDEWASKLSDDSELFKLLEPDSLSDEEKVNLNTKLTANGFNEASLQNIRLAKDALKQKVASESVNTKLELITRNEMLQKENLGIALLDNADVLMKDVAVDLSLKAKALMGMKSKYGVVTALTAKKEILNGKLAEAISEGREDEVNQLWDHDIEREKYVPVEPKTMALFEEHIGLTPEQLVKRSEKIKSETDRLIDELNSLRVGGDPEKQQLSEIEVKQLKREWGIIEATQNNEVTYDIEEESVMENLLKAQAMRIDGTEALKLHIESIKKGDSDSAVKAYEAANIKVAGESMEQIMHSLVLGTVNGVEAQAAIKTAQELGLVEADKLRDLLVGGKDLAKKVGKFVGGSTAKMYEALKNPENWKKMGKALLIGLGVALLMAILAVSAAVSSLGGGR